MLRLAVAVVCLIGADSQTSAAGMLARVPDLKDSAERRGQVARWLHDLYPTPRADDAPGGEWLGPLRPDRLAERLVVDELAGRPELVAPWFTGLDEGRSARALTVLARAALTQEQAIPLLGAALSADLDQLAVPALSVAMETNPVLGEQLAQIIGSQPVSRQTLEKIAASSPYPSLALAAPAAVALQLLADGASEGSDRARTLVDLSRRLADLGRREEALASIEKAITIYRQLARDQPDKFLPHLAASLNNQSAYRAYLGRQEEALEASQLAAFIYIRLADDRPDVFLPRLAALSITRRSSWRTLDGTRRRSRPSNWPSKSIANSPTTGPASSCPTWPVH